MRRLIQLLQTNPAVKSAVKSVSGSFILHYLFVLFSISLSLCVFAFLCGICVRNLFVLINNLLISQKVKESSRGVKTAYKKWRDNGSQHPNFNFGLSSPQHSDRPDGNGSLSSTGSYGSRKVTHRSAPSSPVCSKRLEREINVNGVGREREQTSLQLHGAAVQHSGTSARRGPIPLAMSSSSSHIPPNGHALGAPMPAHFDHHVAASPAVSSASSLCSSSEMNLSQELQNHPLFKTPAVDRSVSSLVRAYESRLQKL